LGGLVLAQIAASLFLARGETLTIASDWIQGALLLMATVAFAANILPSRCALPRIRLFWILMTSGMSFWLVYQGLWNYFEVIRRTDVPNPFSGDVILFLHLLPMIAALALRPHQRHQERDARIGVLNFSLLLTWWVFLYVYTVIPWQYVIANEAAYSSNFNQLYLTEKLVLLLALIVVTYTSLGKWRQLYAQLLGASALYASSSYVANWAIAHQIYYSGSIYDIPLTFSIAWIALIGKFSRPMDSPERQTQSLLGVWVTRVGMLAVFSLPWFALRAELDPAVDHPVIKFRITLSLLTMFVMGGMVFWRQSLLGFELERLLESSRRSFRDLQALQYQLIQSEKLASLGRLVGGAAHEINNPLAAMLGYSDLISASVLPPQEKELATRIGEQVRRTKTLVASLLTFARQAPARMNPVDINSILQTALRLIQPQLDVHSVPLQLELGTAMPPIKADSNQILHVCLHLVSQTGVQLTSDSSGLHIRTAHEGDVDVVEFASIDRVRESSEWIPFNSDAAGLRSTLSLNACYRIASEHGGRILARHTHAGPVAFRLELPVTNQGVTAHDAALRVQAAAN
jgi:signal transduction histidine kinase